MEKALDLISDSLNEIVYNLEKYEGKFGDIYFGDNVGGAAFVRCSELKAEVFGLCSLVEEVRGCDAGDFGDKIKEYVPVLNKVNHVLLPLFDGNQLPQALLSFLVTIYRLRGVLCSVLERSGPDRIKGVSGKLREIEFSLEGLGSRLVGVDKKVSAIESGFEKAEQLDRYIDSVRNNSDEVLGIFERIKDSNNKIQEFNKFREEFSKNLLEIERDARTILGQCEKVYSAATSVGLASAFDERSRVLHKSMLLWVLGLVFSLSVGWYFGGEKVQSLLGVINSPEAPLSIVLLNFLLSALSVGAPIWFAWLATKQIGQRFRLSEDYAFKASISRAYEGYCREAARIGGSDMEEKLLASALSRLDELPLRLVETPSHGSPLHELLSSESVKKALGTVPGFVDDVKSMAKRKLNTSTSFKSASDANAQQSS